MRSSQTRSYRSNESSGRSRLAGSRANDYDYGDGDGSGLASEDVALLSTDNPGSGVSYEGTSSIRRRSPNPLSSSESQQQSGARQQSRHQMAERGKGRSGSRANPVRAVDSADRTDVDYIIYDDVDATRSNRSDRSRRSRGASPEAPRQQQQQQEEQPYGEYRQQYYEAAKDPIVPAGQQQLLEVPEEVLAVRRAALTVFSPLTYTWLVVSIGFSTSIALGMARWTNLLPDTPYWAILLPSWMSHVGLFFCHVFAAKALSTFIAEANDNRQRQDSTDHLDRTEYLPLLQRSLKFGLKTGLLSFCIFVFEILIYLRVAKGNMSLGLALTPIWIIVVFGVIDGIICKTQHVIRLLCWLLLLASMVMIVLKIDHGYNNIRWRVVVSPIVAMLSISSATLIYIVYGHQVGYFRLTESQLTAGILYSMAALICILLVVAMGEIIPNVDPEEVEMRMFVVALAPLVMALLGMGAWAVSRDEFERLLQYGGQAAIHPMKLRLEPQGWTAVETKGVTIIPMFGEVSYAPLDSSQSDSLELCACCACYPYEDEDEMPLHQNDNRDLGSHPYLSSVSSQQSGRTGEAAIPSRPVV